MKKSPILVLCAGCLVGLSAGASTVITDKPSRFMKFVTCQSRTGFDTGVKIESGQTVEMKVATTYTGGNLNWVDFICDQAASASNHGKIIKVSNLSSKTSLIVNGTTVAAVKWSHPRCEDVVLKLAATSGAITLTANGETIGTSTEAISSSAGNWRLLGSQCDDSYSTYRLYYAQIRDADGKLLADFKPAICRGQVALYDAVSQKSHFFDIDGSCQSRWHAGPGVTTAKTQTLDYAEMTTSQSDAWLDTGVRARSGTKVEATFSLASTAGDFGVVGARSSSKGRFMAVHVYQNQFRCGYGNDSKASTKTVEPNTVYTVVSDFHCGSQTIVVDGKTVYTGTSTANVDTGGSLALFATREADTAQTYMAPSGTRIMRVKIWQGNADGTDYALVRDYTPVWQDGYFGYVDAVSGTALDLPTTYFSWPDSLFADVKPESYLQYVESNRGAQIDTGVVAGDGFKAELDLALAYGAGYQYKNFPILLVDTVKAFEPFSVYSGKSRISYNGSQKDGTVFRLGERQTVVSEMFSGSQCLTVDGTVYAQLSGSGYSGTETVKLFGWKESGYSPVRLYGLKIWKGSSDGSNLELVRDFKPAICGGRVALYDAVGQKAYFDTTSPRGSLVAGPRVGAKPKFYEYLTSNGKQFIDTRVVGKTPLSAEMDMQWGASAKTSNIFVLGMRYGSSVRMVLGANCDKWQLAYGANWWDVGSGVTDARKQVEAVFEAGNQKLVVDGETLTAQSVSAAIDAPLNLYVFARNYDGATDFSVATCWSLKLSRGDELLRSFRPCRLDGHTGFWDDVSESFFPAASFPFTREQEFEMGPKIPVGLMLLLK